MAYAPSRASIPVSPFGQGRLAPGRCATTWATEQIQRAGHWASQAAAWPADGHRA